VAQDTLGLESIRRKRVTRCFYGHVHVLQGQLASISGNHDTGPLVGEGVQEFMFVLGQPLIKSTVQAMIIRSRFTGPARITRIGVNGNGAGAEPSRPFLVFAGRFRPRTSICGSLRNLAVSSAPTSKCMSPDLADRAVTRLRCRSASNVQAFRSFGH